MKWSILSTKFCKISLTNLFICAWPINKKAHSAYGKNGPSYFLALGSLLLGGTPCRNLGFPRRVFLVTRGFHSNSVSRRLVAWALNGEPGADRHVCAGKGIGASIYESCSVQRKRGEFRPPKKTVEHIGGQGVAGFNLHGIEKPRFLNQEIDLVPSPVAPEEQGGCATVVGRKQKHDETCLQHGDPASRSR